MKRHMPLVAAAVATLVVGWSGHAVAGPPSADPIGAAVVTAALTGSSLLAAGDVASCSVTTDSATAGLIAVRSGLVAPVGDAASPVGSTSDYTDCYGPTWGLYKSRTRPAPGNRDYSTPGATGYFGYFGGSAGPAGRGYYSYTLGTWHVVVLNSNCAQVPGGCGTGSAQQTWLRNDLSANPTACTVAYWHDSLFTSGADHSGAAMRPLFQTLYDSGAEIVLGAQDRQYERFAPQDPAGVADPVSGIREFVVGTGGQPLEPFATIAPNSEVRNDTTHGILRLILGVGAYTWEFVPVAGQTFTDGGSGTCHVAPVVAKPQSLLAAGDIASCATSGDSATAALVGARPGTVATLGDAAYPHGALASFTDCYGPTWGQVKDRTRPAPGNHEYETTGAAGYYGYFGPAAGDPTKGYYSYELGNWHIVALNSNCALVIGGCGVGSAQETWLRADLAAHPGLCTLAYWHQPLFTSGLAHSGALATRPLFQALYDAGAEIVLTGHNHNYERFAAQTPAGAADPARGVREWVVGTGGMSHYSFGVAQPNSQVRNADTFGVLQLTLAATGYSWQFLPVAGQTFTDTGSDTCH